MGGSTGGQLRAAVVVGSLGVFGDIAKNSSPRRLL